MMVNQKLLCFTTVAILFLFNPLYSSAKDPVFAVPVNVPLFAIGNETNQLIQFVRFSLVNGLWLNYLTGITIKNETVSNEIIGPFNGEAPLDQPKKIFVTIINTPRLLTFVTSQQRSFNYSEDEGTKLKIVQHVFNRVAKDYMFYSLGLRNVKIINGYDRSGVRLSLFPKQRTPLFFNRTFVIRFDDPPYGQSLSNLLVTNRNIDWQVNERDLTRIDNNKQAAANDLIYRYYHNIGHALGFGHYRSLNSQPDVRVVKNHTRYVQYLAAIKKTNYYLSTTPVRGQPRLQVDSPLRSVMYANISDHAQSAGFPTNLDRHAMRYIALYFNQLIDQFINNFIVNELSPTLLSMVNMARYFS